MPLLAAALPTASRLVKGQPGGRQSREAEELAKRPSSPGPSESFQAGPSQDVAAQGVGEGQTKGRRRASH